MAMHSQSRRDVPTQFAAKQRCELALSNKLKFLYTTILLSSQGFWLISSPVFATLKRSKSTDVEGNQTTQGTWQSYSFSA
ncbi:MAG: hypothetical protein CBB71_21200 [Rhodopirellula sp. TMED11]|nr:MAG: hypothetical protein CBB71_21200 [Rhodopirellula sp. TMED11]